MTEAANSSIFYGDYQLMSRSNLEDRNDTQV